jgi:hypothetical protein
MTSKQAGFNLAYNSSWQMGLRIGLPIKWNRLNRITKYCCIKCKTLCIYVCSTQLSEMEGGHRQCDLETSTTQLVWSLEQMKRLISRLKNHKRQKWTIKKISWWYFYVGWEHDDDDWLIYNGIILRWCHMSLFLKNFK